MISSLSSLLAFSCSVRESPCRHRGCSVRPIHCALTPATLTTTGISPRSYVEKKPNFVLKGPAAGQPIAARDGKAAKRSGPRHGALDHAGKAVKQAAKTPVKKANKGANFGRRRKGKVRAVAAAPGGSRFALGRRACGGMVLLRPFLPFFFGAVLLPIIVRRL